MSKYRELGAGSEADEAGSCCWECVLLPALLGSCGPGRLGSRKQQPFC